MKKIKTTLVLVISSCFIAGLSGCHKKANSEEPSQTPIADSLARPDHVILVWFENKGFSEIVGSSSAPYINSLIKKGTLFTNSYALTHPSYPNYISFLGGSSQGVTTNNCIEGTPFNTPNLYSVLKEAGKTFAWYSEDLPTPGSGVCQSGNYVERHNPTTIFSTVATTANKALSSFPSDYSKLEQVVCITPNLINDMHDAPVSQGDAWLKKNLSALIDWCETHNSVFIVYWDEDNGASDNRIPVIAVGEPVKVGYQSEKRYDHYNWTKTICSMFMAKEDWTENLKSKEVIKDCWK